MKELEIIQRRAAKVILGCSQRTSGTTARAELGVHSLITERDVRNETPRDRNKNGVESD